jgi:hypothetical protein
MNAQRHSRLNQLLHELPEGYVADTAWLKSLGLSASSIQGYVRQGWLQHVAPRLYQRGNPALGAQGPVRWEICLLSLQNVMKRPIHAGAQTALELAGYWQYAVLGKRRVWLYTDDRPTRLVLTRAPLDAELQLRARSLFKDDALGLETRTLDLVTSTLGAPVSPIRSPLRNQQLTISSLERAILEVLAEIPSAISFDHGEELFDGLTTLRPSLMKELLQSCTSIKAKRLFFYFAAQHKSLRRRVRPEEFDLGSGKRQIVAGGQYDPQFRITVPRRRRQR